MESLRGLLASLLAVCCLTSSLCARKASAVPSASAAVSAGRQLGDDSPGASYLTYSPLLLDMARAIGRSGVPPTFFLQNDADFNQPGIDLRTLLLYQSGILKMPVRLTSTGKPPEAPAVPFLKAPSIQVEPGEMRQSNAAEGPRLNRKPLPPEPERSQVVSPRPEVGSPDRISLPLAPSRISAVPSLSFDASTFQSSNWPLNEQSSLPAISLALPGIGAPVSTQTRMPSFDPRFRLWTLQGSPGSSKQAPSAAGARDEEYSGSFVIATTKAIKSIRGRDFTLSPGSLLVHNAGEKMLFSTPAAEIGIGAGSSALISTTATGLTRVLALESTGDGITVQATAGRKELVKLVAGEAAVFSERDLEAGDLQNTYFTTRSKLSSNIIKGTFSLSQALSRDEVFRSAMNANVTYRRAVDQLKRRLSFSR